DLRAEAAAVCRRAVVGGRHQSVAVGLRGLVVFRDVDFRTVAVDAGEGEKIDVAGKRDRAGAHAHRGGSGDVAVVLRGRFKGGDRLDRIGGAVVDVKLERSVAVRAGDRGAADRD